MRKIKNFVFHSWREGRYWDRWVVVHILSGLILGLLLRMTGMHLLWAVSITFIAVILWEVFEIWRHVFESASNRIGDIAVALVGFFVAYSLIPTFGFVGDIVLLSSFVLFWGILELSGWRAWLAHKNQ